MRPIMLVALAALLSCSAASDVTDPTTSTGLATTGPTIDPAKGHLGKFPGAYPKAALNVIAGPNTGGQYAGIALFGDKFRGTKCYPPDCATALVWEWTRKVGFVDLIPERSNAFARNVGGHVQLNDNGTVLTSAYEGWPNDGLCDLFIDGQPQDLQGGLPTGTGYVCISPLNDPGSLNADNSIDVYWYTSAHSGTAHRSAAGVWTLGPPIL